MSLHFDEGRSYIIKELKANPYNLMATYIADYEDFILLILNGDKKDFNQRKEHFEARLSLLENADKSSPWYRFCKAGIYIHWTMIYIRLGENLKGASAFRKSYMLLKENSNLFPNFEYNMIFEGMEEAIVGTIPGNYKWIASIFGVTGSIKTGTEKLFDFISSHADNKPLLLETKLYYYYTSFYFSGKQKEIWNIVNNQHFQLADNLLNLYIKITMALDYNKGEEALMSLNIAEKEKDFIKFPIFYFQAGMAHLYNLDSTCICYFNMYIENNKSKTLLNSAWQKKSFYYYIIGKKDSAEYCKEQIKNYTGSDFDADKQAIRFAENKQMPNARLLKVRFLLDGGYQQKALNILSNISLSELENDGDKAEYYYRYGRAYEITEENGKALNYFNLSIKAGKDRKEQFAARACLHKGIIYEKTGNKQLALECYNATLDMPNHDFQNSIDQQAKAGINRINN